MCGLIGALLGAPALAAPPPMDELVKVELAAESASVAPAMTLWVDAHFRIKPGWHIYWRNPGDSGLPTTIEWSLPPGFSAGEIEWPVPDRFVVSGLANYGYGGDTDLLVPIALPAALDASAGARLDAHVSWLVCAEICIPGETQLGLSLPVGAAAPPDPSVAARFVAARGHLPKPAPFATSFAASAHELRLTIPAAARSGLDHPRAAFFPYSDAAIDQAADARAEARGGGLDVVLPKATGPTTKIPAALDGVLVLRGADGTTRAYTISAAPGPAAPPDEPMLGWWQALVFAFLGGLILNLMPCVFPILSLKLLSLAGSAGRQERRLQGAAYGIGVLFSFALLGGSLIVLRAGGAAIGWGFQLQSPLVVALLAYLLLAMGLSLSGVTEFGVGLAGTGGRLAARGGVAGAFFTGVLATIVATPCTAPFMGAALGLALVAPAPLALAIFLALGAGLAAPLTAASFIPHLARLLPRPGRWMELFKQLLAFPLYATVAWLVWVLIQEVAPADAFAALLGLVLVGFAVWLHGRTRLSAATARQLGGSVAAVGLAVAVALAAMLTPATGPVPLTNDGIAYEPFTNARLAALTTEHKPVFVNLTAAWCITCLVNERATLDSAPVRRALADHGVVALKGDWTRQDPEITALLQRFGRSGVPLYLLYGGDGSATVLPQILTESGVIDAVSRL
jgi:thiol:disulfide interchange protein